MNSASNHFESTAHSLVGRLVFTYSRLDFNLALFVAARHGAGERGRSIAALETLSFKVKLDWVLPTVKREYPNNFNCHQEWQTWVAEANALRLNRNSMVHGRWGLSETGGFVANVTGLPGSPNQREVRYTLIELQAEVERAEGVAHNFYILTKKWPS